MRVLVAYASKYKSTAEIAEAIGATLRQTGGLHVDVTEVNLVRSLDEYNAVVLGSALYVGQWLPPAVAFMHDHLEQLSNMPVWMFASGPAGHGDVNDLMKSWFLYPPALRTLFTNIRPRDFTVFHGKLCPENLDPIERVVIQKVNAEWGDFRRWDEIHAWARRIRIALATRCNQEQAEIHQA